MQHFISRCGKLITCKLMVFCASHKMQFINYEPGWLFFALVQTCEKCLFDCILFRNNLSNDLYQKLTKSTQSATKTLKARFYEKPIWLKGGGAKVVRHFYNMLKQWKGWKYSRRVRERMGKQAYSIKHVDPHFSHPIYRILNFTPACTLNN